MKIKTITIPYYLILSLLILPQCAKEQIKTIYLKAYPNIILNIIENNKKIPSFTSDFTLSINKISLDGYIAINKKTDSISLKLNDTLTNKQIIDASIIKENVKLLLTLDKGSTKLISGTRSSINLAKHFDDFNISLDNLLYLISLKVFMIDNANIIIKQNNSKLKAYTLFKLSNSKTTESEVLSIENKTRLVNKLSFSKQGRAIFTVDYKKYKLNKNFFYPQRIDFYHKLTKTKLIIFFANTKFK